MDIEERVAKIERWIENYENSIKKLNEDTERKWREYENDKIADVERDTKSYVRLGLLDSQLRHQLEMIRNDIKQGLAEIKALLR